MKLVLIEDQSMFRGIVLKLCRDAFPCERLEAAATGTAGLALCASVQPDVVLLDLDLPDIYGLDLIDQIAAAAKSAKIIVLSSHTEEYVVQRCLSAQIDGFVDKNDEPAEVILDAIESVLAGRPFFTAAVSRRNKALRDDPLAFNKVLSEREQELLCYFGQGLSNEEIGAKVGISPNTVLNHRRNVMGKLGIHSAPELMRHAVEKGFTRLRATL